MSNCPRLRLQRIEKSIRQQGYQHIAGIDEAGRGPLAGPVVASACVLPEGNRLSGVNDSKQLSVSQRLALFEEIISLADVDIGIGVVDALLIDQINILQATFQSMLIAISRLKCTPDFILVDGLHLPSTSIPGEALVEGDCRCQSIAAASIIAKVTRDRIMDDYDLLWPAYGFSQHKGYGTVKHLEALAIHGASPIHRMTFSPLKDSKL